MTIKEKNNTTEKVLMNDVFKTKYSLGINVIVKKKKLK